METTLVPLTELHRGKLKEMVKGTKYHPLSFYIAGTAPLTIHYVTDGKTYKVPWIEFTLCELSKSILGETDPSSKRKTVKKGRRPYYLQIMGNQFGKVHPVDFLFNEYLKLKK